MCVVEANGRVRFGAREWIGIIGVMLTAVAMTSALQVYIMDLKISTHTSRLDIHEDRLVKGLQYMSHNEFKIWAEAHERHPHFGVEAWQADAGARLRLLESYHQLKGRNP